jgi:hypothetical protein
MEHFLLQLVLVWSSVVQVSTFSTHQTGRGIMVFSFCFSQCLACTGMGYHCKNFIPLGVLCISSNTQCVTLQKYKTLLEMVIGLYFWWTGSHHWFLYTDFFSSLSEAPISFSVFSANQVASGGRGRGFFIFNFDRGTRIPGTLKEGINGPIPYSTVTCNPMRVMWWFTTH